MSKGSRYIPRVLSIAGSDPFAGAGIQLDLKTFQALGVYGFTAITSITAQNTKGVRAVQNLEHELVRLQIEAVATDSPVDAVKVGLAGTESTIQTVADSIKYFGFKNLVVDPIIASHSGIRFLSEGEVDRLVGCLITGADLVTPNFKEAEILSGIKITTVSDAERAGKLILGTGVKNVVIKGGHAPYGPVDLLLTGDGGFFEIESETVAAKTVHGTGCAYSASVAAYLAEGEDVQSACRLAKQFVASAIKNSVQIGKGQKCIF